MGSNETRSDSFANKAISREGFGSYVKLLLDARN